jgi:hypothetical protein
MGDDLEAEATRRLHCIHDLPSLFLISRISLQYVIQEISYLPRTAHYYSWGVCEAWRQQEPDRIRERQEYLRAHV